MTDTTWYHIDDQPQLFVDDVMIESANGVTRRWHKPRRHSDTPLIKRDRPWEQALYFTYSNHIVIRDSVDGLIKCWYEDLGEVDGTSHPWKNRLLYAESKDGINFTKPALDICQWEGKPTNIVMGYHEQNCSASHNPWSKVGVHSNGIVIDPFPATPDERFKTIFSEATCDAEGLRHRITCAHSSDGLHWIPYPWTPKLGSSGGHLSDVSTLHYDPGARMFVQNTRHGLMYSNARPPGTPYVAKWFAPHFPGRPDLMSKRRVYQTQSHDFQHWSEPLLVSSPTDAFGEHPSCDNLDTAHYGMQQFKVGRRHFATLGVFRHVDNEMDVRLLSSLDGLHFVPTDRGTPFLAPRGAGHWDAHMVSIASQPIEMNGEWFFYHGGSRVHHDWWMAQDEDIDHIESRDARNCMKDGFGLGLARLRKEGFASLDAGQQRPGAVTTQPFKTNGNTLIINARCRPGGSIKIAVLDIDHQPLEARNANHSDVFAGDSTTHTATWNGSSSVGSPGEWRRLVFYLHNAEIFSFRCLPSTDV